MQTDVEGGDEGGKTEEGSEEVHGDGCNNEDWIGLMIGTIASRWTG